MDPALIQASLIELINDLRLRGYRIGAEQFVSANDILVFLTSGSRSKIDPGQLRGWLAPVLCSTPREQEDFEEYFDRWLGPHFDAEFFSGPEPEELEKADPWWHRLLSSSRFRGVGIAALVAGIVIAALVIFDPFEPGRERFASGYVHVFGEGSSRIAGAEITLNENTVYSDTTGHFSIRYIHEAAQADLKVSHSRYLDSFLTIDLDQEKPLNDIIFMLDEKPVEIMDETEAPPELVIQEMPIAWVAWYSQHRSAIQVAIVLLLFLPVILRLFWRVVARRMVLRRRRGSEQTHLDRIVVTGQDQPLFGGRALRRTIQEFRRHREVESNQVDPDATVSKTVLSGGLFLPVYATKPQLPEYLALIDRASFQDHQSELMTTMLRRLTDNGVHILRYFYNQDPRRCWTGDMGSPHVSLNELSARFPEHRLLVFGDISGLFDPVTGEAADWIDQLESWKVRGLFTMQMPDYWGYGEWAIIQRGFNVLPANEMGLSVFMQVIHHGLQSNQMECGWTPPFPPLLTDRVDKWMSRQAPERDKVDQLIGQLQVYLGSSGMMWLGACAVYPALSWSLTTYLGYSLTNKDNEPLLSVELASALSRLPWFRHGRIPDWLRLRLLDELSDGSEQKIRDSLTNLFAQTKKSPENNFSLEMASKDSPDLPYWKQFFAHYLRSEPPNSAMRDFVFLEFISSRQLSKLMLVLPKTLRKNIFPHGWPSQGVRPLFSLGLAGLTAALAWFALPVIPDLPEILVFETQQEGGDSQASLGFKLLWETDGAETVQIRGIGRVDFSGETSIPSQPGEYVYFLTAQNRRGETQAQLYLPVEELVQEQPVTSLDSDPNGQDPPDEGPGQDQPLATPPSTTLEEDQSDTTTQDTTIVPEISTTIDPDPTPNGDQPDPARTDTTGVPGTPEVGQPESNRNTFPLYPADSESLNNGTQIKPAEEDSMPGKPGRPYYIIDG